MPSEQPTNYRNPPMKWVLFVLPIIFLVIVPFAGHAQREDLLQEETRKVAASVLTGGAIEKLRELCDRFGGRVTGTASYTQAAEWAAQQFRAAGIQNVKFEPITIPNGWQRGWAESQMYSPFQRKLHLESVGWAPSTPRGGVKGEVVVVPEISEASLRSNASAIKDRIVLLDTDRVFASGFNQSYAKLTASYSVFKSLGAQALLLPDAVSNNVLGDWLDLDNGKGEVLPLPVAEIGMEDSLLIRRLLARERVIIGFSYENQISGPVTSNNVIAEIPGDDRSGGWIIVGAHLDSWDLATGAQDNGTGVIMVLEAARAIASLPHPPRRTIRFALWTGEEPGLLGSRTYVRTHTKELKQCVAVVNTDNGAGRPRGWIVEGREDLKVALPELIPPYLRGYGSDLASLETTFDTDHGPFMLYGIPAFDLWVDDQSYNAVHHKSSDTIDKVDPAYFEADGAMVATLAYVIAQREKPVGAHLDHAAVGEILKKAQLDGYLTAHGDWEP
jgi:carboxypeptidase Q